MSDSKREVFDVKEAVSYLRGLISEWLLRREINNGELPLFGIGKRILIDKAELDRWIEEQVKHLSCQRCQRTRSCGG